MTRRHVVLAAALALVAGCVNTPIRRSAFVPRNAIPANHGAPIGDGGLKAFAQVNSFELSFGKGPVKTAKEFFERIPTEGAAGLWIPTVQAGAGIYGAPNEYIEVGAQAVYTRLDWAEPNLNGVLPFPAEHSNQHILMGGPGLRVNIPIEGVIVTPAFVFEANVAAIPQAVFVRTGNTTVGPDGEIDFPEYEFERIDKKTFILPTLAVHLTVTPLEYVHVLGVVGVQRNVKNIGFDPNIENLDNHTLSGYLHGFAGGGVEGRYQKFFATAVVHSAFAKPREIRFGLSATASAGVVFN